MRAIYVRPIAQQERKTLDELQSSDGVVVWRSQIILMSADEDLKAQGIARRVGYSDETVHQVIGRFN